MTGEIDICYGMSVQTVRTQNETAKMDKVLHNPDTIRVRIFKPRDPGTFMFM
jgi:hypothetical protein